MVGCGVWDPATRQPSRFAAIAPVCGSGIPRLAGRIKRFSVWALMEPYGPHTFDQQNRKSWLMLWSKLGTNQVHGLPRCRSRFLDLQHMMIRNSQAGSCLTRESNARHVKKTINFKTAGLLFFDSKVPGYSKGENK